MTFTNIGYDGTVFRDYYAARCPHSGPGWFIFGRDSQKYGTLPNGKGAYVRLCGYRHIRNHPHYNGKVRHGWRTRREALEQIRSL